MENLVPILILAVIVGVLIAVAAYYILRFLRGSIKLTLPRTGFSGGETITGSFVVMTKKEIQGNRLIVSLVGQRVTRSTDSDGDSKTRTDEIYRDEVLIEDARVYPAGFTQEYNFEINVPNMADPEFANSTMGQVLTTAMRLLSDRRTRLKWRVEARLDAKGIDLAASKAVSVATGSGGRSSR